MSSHFLKFNSINLVVAISSDTYLTIVLLIRKVESRLKNYFNKFLINS